MKDKVFRTVAGLLAAWMLAGGIGAAFAPGVQAAEAPSQSEDAGEADTSMPDDADSSIPNDEPAPEEPPLPAEPDSIPVDSLPPKSQPTETEPGSSEPVDTEPEDTVSQPEMPSSSVPAQPSAAEEPLQEPSVADIPEPEAETEAAMQTLLGFATDPASGTLYYQLADGNRAEGWFTTAEGQLCYARAGGAITAGWLEDAGARYYLNEWGAPLTGYFDADGTHYYAQAGGAVVTAKGWFARSEDGALIYVQKGGAIQPGWVKASASKSYRINVDGARLTGYFTVNGKKYYATATGAVRIKAGWVTRSEDSAKIYVQDKGVVKSGWVTSGGKRYRVNADGEKLTGYFKVNGKKYYAQSSGVVKTTAGWVTRSEDKVKIYVHDKGIIKSAWVEAGDGKRYRVNADGEKLTGYFKVNGKKYYARSNGLVKTTAGWVTRSEDKAKIYVQDKGIIKSAWVEASATKRYRVNADGEKLTGYFKVNGKTYYAKKDGSIKTTAGWVTRSEDKAKIYVHAKGVVKAGLVTGSKKMYYVDAEGLKVDGYFKAGKRWYITNKGLITTGWKTIGENRYYVGSKGYLLTGSQKINGVRYRFDSDGRLLDVASATLSVTMGGTKMTDTAENILALVVMAEVGGFGDAETFKAQAIAAHTYILYQHSIGNAWPSVPQPNYEPTAKLRAAVAEVAHLHLSYKGAPALTTYYAASNGHTNNSGDFWKVQHPYLVSVDSIYENADNTNSRFKSEFKSTVTLTLDEFRALMDKTYGAGNYSLQDDPAQWIAVNYNAAGYATGNITIGQASGSIKPRSPSVEYFYQTMLGLRSPAFTVKYSASKGALSFSVKGYGHGVGMSQWGAYFYSTQGGWNYKQILAHYYPGTTLSP